MESIPKGAVTRNLSKTYKEPQANIEKVLTVKIQEKAQMGKIGESKTDDLKVSIRIFKN